MEALGEGPPIKDMKRARWVTLEEARILFDIVAEMDVPYVLESGTANGYSAAWMACAGAHVITFDPHDRKKVWELHPELVTHVTYVQDKFVSAIRRYAFAADVNKMFYIDGDHGYDSLRS